MFSRTRDTNLGGDRFSLPSESPGGTLEYSYVEPDRVRIERPVPSNVEQTDDGDNTDEETSDLASNNLYEPLPSTTGDDVETHANDCYEATMESQGHFIVHENESYLGNGAPEVHFEVSPNESYQGRHIDMRRNESYELQNSNTSNPVTLNNPSVRGNDTESICLATDNLYERLPSITGDSLELNENDCYETTLESQGHFVVHENESYQVNGTPSVHFEINPNESYQTNVNMRRNQCYDVLSSNLVNREVQHNDSQLHNNQSGDIGTRENQRCGINLPSNSTGVTVETRRNPSYQLPSSQANQVVVISQPQPPPGVTVVPSSRAPSTAVLTFAIILTFAMGIQCFIPLYLCVFPGLILAMMGYSMGSYKKYGHTGRAYNGVSLCCNVTAVLFYFMTVFTTIVTLMSIYGGLYSARVNTNTARSSSV